MTYLVIRARSDRGVTKKIRDTMMMLNLTRVNHATLVPENVTYLGMLKKSKDYITWGEVDADTIETLLKERGRMVGDKPCLLYTSPSPRDKRQSRMPSSA